MSSSTHRTVPLRSLFVTVMQEDGTWRKAPLHQSYYVLSGRVGDRTVYDTYHARLQRLLFQDTPLPHMDWEAFHLLIDACRTGAFDWQRQPPIRLTPDNEIHDGQHRCAALLLAHGEALRLRVDSQFVTGCTPLLEVV